MVELIRNPLLLFFILVAFYIWISRVANKRKKEKDKKPVDDLSDLER